MRLPYMKSKLDDIKYDIEKFNIKKDELLSNA